MKKVFKLSSVLGLAAIAGVLLFGCLITEDKECTTWIDGEKVTYSSPCIRFLNRADFSSTQDNWSEPENYSFDYEIWHGDCGPSTYAHVAVVDGNSTITSGTETENPENEKCNSISALMRFFENYYQARITAGNEGNACFYHVVFDSTVKNTDGNSIKVPYKMGEFIFDFSESDAPDGFSYGDLHIYIRNVKIN